MILFVDDDSQRHIAFSRAHPGAFHTASIVLAQFELNQTPGYVTELWLDHDLGETLLNGGFFDPTTGVAVGTECVTIMPLVKWMCESSVVPRDLKIFIHSFNTPASHLMKSRLEAAGYLNVVRKPFSFVGESL